MSTIRITQTSEVPVVTASDHSEKRKQSPFKALLQSQNFMLMWLGEAISLIGDQFYMIALPWLTLQLTGNPFVMGTVLAVGGIPRALFMLVGGALTDRFSSRSVMLISNLLRMVLVALLAVMVLTATIQVWMLFIFALLFGLIDALFFPAQSSIVPQLVKAEQLQTANSIVMMTQQLSLFGGPILAGAVIAMFATTSADTDFMGIGIAFAIDALTFLASAITLWIIRMPITKAKTSDEPEQDVLASIRDGLHYVRQNPILRSIFILIVFANVLISAPMAVGIPVLADTRLMEGAAAFGIIISAFGGGTVIGMILGGVLPRPDDSHLGLVIMTVWSTMGIGTALMGLATTTPVAAILGAGMGTANGYVVIIFLTWLQTNTPDSMMGRMMSLFGFSTVGLSPIANAGLSAIISWNLSVAFVGAGLLMTVVVLGALLINPSMRSMQMLQPVDAEISQ